MNRHSVIIIIIIIIIIIMHIVSYCIGMEKMLLLVHFFV